MLLESTEVHNFRNLSGKISWGKDLNIICGDNGHGKTNWLEAIYLLSTTKSFRTQHLNEAIRFGEDLTVVRGTILKNQETVRELQINLQGKQKSFSINGKRTTISSYLPNFSLVAFTADELGVVRGATDFRRKFLDRGVLSIKPLYVDVLSNFNRVIKQKNHLFRELSESGASLDRVLEMLEPWNEQLVGLSESIHRARIDYVDQLNAALERNLFSRESLSIRYVSSLEGKGDLADYRHVLAERLRLRLPAELAAGYSLIGPHRDDLEILFDGREMRSFGSSGQQRSALLLLDLAAISVYYSAHNEHPVFLIDDVDAEIDRKRIGALLEYLEGRTQTFITTSKESLVNQFVSRANVYQIRDGMLEAPFEFPSQGEFISSVVGDD
jgi:DNA replication and repair protein RecF